MVNSCSCDGCRKNVGEVTSQEIVEESHCIAVDKKFLIESVIATLLFIFLVIEMAWGAAFFGWPCVLYVAFVFSIVLGLVILVLLQCKVGPAVEEMPPPIVQKNWAKLPWVRLAPLVLAGFAINYFRKYIKGNIGGESPGSKVEVDLNESFRKRQRLKISIIVLTMVLGLVIGLILTLTLPGTPKGEVTVLGYPIRGTHDIPLRVLSGFLFVVLLSIIFLCFEAGRVFRWIGVSVSKDAHSAMVTASGAFAAAVGVDTSGEQISIKEEVVSVVLFLVFINIIIVMLLALSYRNLADPNEWPQLKYWDILCTLAVLLLGPISISFISHFLSNNSGDVGIYLSAMFGILIITFLTVWRTSKIWSWLETGSYERRIP